KLDTPWPFPEDEVKDLVANAKNVLVVELNLGQMFYEVDRVLGNDTDVHLMGQIGGLMPTPEEILAKINNLGGN
ncbi:MAG: 2-oxoacid:acceptor oxidoreductase subunit alpha, partial [Methanobrevibacter sp.]|nr:2-oxoacid:acceptor oxidoreductase subunit alpha [Methanobrevibacter sp.]